MRHTGLVRGKGYEGVSYSVRLPPAKALRTRRGRVREGEYPLAHRLSSLPSAKDGVCTVLIEATA